MPGARLISWSLLVAGVASLVYAGLSGDLEVFVLVVVPVVAGTGPWAALGLLATIAGVGGLVWTGATRRVQGRQPPRGRGSPGSPQTGQAGTPEASQRAEGEPETRGGGVILLGPIPIAWGSDRRTVGWLVVAGIVLTVAAIALTLLVRP